MNTQRQKTGEDIFKKGRVSALIPNPEAKIFIEQMEIVQQNPGGVE